jgi:hypothetical protein
MVAKVAYARLGVAEVGMAELEKKQKTETFEIVFGSKHLN